MSPSLKMDKDSIIWLLMVMLYMCVISFLCWSWLSIFFVVVSVEFRTVPVCFVSFFGDGFVISGNA